MIRRWGLVLLLLVSQTAATQNQKLEIVKLADGVYAGVYSELRVDPVEGNTLIVIGHDGVLVFDSGHSPQTARTMMSEIRKLTSAPVRYVVNSHWHDDHVHGNQGYQEAFPGAQFIAHNETRIEMVKQSIPNLKTYGPEYWTKMADDQQAILSKGTNSQGKPLTDKQKARLQEQIQTIREFLPKLDGLRIVLPTVTFDNTLTIYLDGREIQLLHLGLANTAGDVAVYLPKEKILAMGDMLVHPVPFCYGSFMAEWIETLKKFRQLDFDALLPGHGPLMMHDRRYLDHVIGLFESLVSQVKDAAKRGLTLEETRKAVDFTDYRKLYVGDDPVHRGIFQDSILRVAIEQAYNAAKGDSRAGPR